ncbi:MAG: LexA family transcriptional regulator [Propionivibrio sp.]|jgi:transcriptional regulator with XRE-family HTH domain|uniref:LexA family transcriptional regulator n=1 Tax=Propionivibrio sp. TaxID=2212460 RepID=UPI001B4DE144|nr:LexA family transcriptional regulator [Propionivibrio sp.]MBP7203306.1 LexA family transcriptional regulator [Propionivibrio sp.]
MNTVVRFGDAEVRSSKQKTFRKQFAENLNAALDRRGAIPSGYGRVVGVAELFGVSQNTAANWLKGDGVPELSRLPEIADILGTTVEQLVVGDRGKDTHVIDENYVMVDMHEEGSLGGYSWYTLPETLRSMGLPKDLRMLQVSSDDMAPYVNSGDAVMYDPRVRRIQTNGVFVFQIGDRFVVRRVQRGIKGDVRLKCDNPLFEDEVLDEAELDESALPGGRISVAGQVVGRLSVGS